MSIEEAPLRRLVEKFEEKVSEENAV